MVFPDQRFFALWGAVPDREGGGGKGGIVSDRAPKIGSVLGAVALRRRIAGRVPWAQAASSGVGQWIVVCGSRHKLPIFQDQSCPLTNHMTDHNTRSLGALVRSMRNGKGCSNPKQQCEKHAPVLPINLHKNVVRSKRNRLLITKRQAYAQLLNIFSQQWSRELACTYRLHLSPYSNSLVPACALPIAMSRHLLFLGLLRVSIS